MLLDNCFNSGLWLLMKCDSHTHTHTYTNYHNQSHIAQRSEGADINEQMQMAETGSDLVRIGSRGPGMSREETLCSDAHCMFGKHNSGREIRGNCWIIIYNRIFTK